MKTNYTRNITFRVILSVLFSLYFIPSFAQPDYTFQGGVLISGTDKQVGAVYKFTNVRPGVDATVTLSVISPGITVVDLDAGSGYSEALQPTLDASPFTNGYLQMDFKLLVAGTNNPYTALLLPVTCIDVDGTLNNDGNGKPLFEFDEVNMGNGGSVDFNTYGGELIISQTGNWYKGKNISGIDYPGRDTAARNVMFTVLNTNVKQFTIRVGVDNQSSVQSQRLRSVYFKKFTYSHFPLPLPKILEFSGNRSGNRIMLNWKMESGGDWQECDLERSSTSAKFAPIAVFLPDDPTLTRYSYTDNLSATGNYFYRLKLVGTHGEIKYTNILAFKTSNDNVSEKLLVYPSLVQDQFTVKFRAENNETTGLLQMVDYSGRTIYSRPINIRQGDNNISVSDFTKIRGNFIVVIRSANGVYSQKIIVQ